MSLLSVAWRFVVSYSYVHGPSEKHMTQIIPLNEIALNESKWTKLRKKKQNEQTKRRLFVYKLFAAKRYRHAISKTDLIRNDHWPLRVLGASVLTRGKDAQQLQFKSCASVAAVFFFAIVRQHLRHCAVCVEWMLSSHPEFNGFISFVRDQKKSDSI